MPIPNRNNTDSINNSGNAEPEDSPNQKPSATDNLHAHGNNSVQAVIEEQGEVATIEVGVVEAVTMAPNQNEHGDFVVEEAKSAFVAKKAPEIITEFRRTATVANSPPTEVSVKTGHASTAKRVKTVNEILGLASPPEVKNQYSKANIEHEALSEKEAARPKGIMAKLKFMLKMTESATVVTKNPRAPTAIPTKRHNNSQEH